MKELEIKDTCPNLNENYHESLSEYQEIYLENDTKTEIEDDLSFMETDIDAPKEEKTENKPYTFMDMVAELLTSKIEDLGEKFVGWKKFNISLDTVKKCIKPFTYEEENFFIKYMNELPHNDSLYSFCLCKFDVIPGFIRRNFVELFLEYKNTIKQSAPTIESLNYAKKLLGLQYHTLTDFDKRILNIKNNGTYQADDTYYYHSGDYDLDMLYYAAVDEFRKNKSVEFVEFDEHDPLDKAIILVDYLYRHDEIVAILEKLKDLREIIRYKMHLPENEYVGF